MTAKKKRVHGSDLRAAGKLAVDATKRVTDIVEAMHHAIGGTPAKIFSAPTYFAIRGVTKVVGSSLDFALARLEPLLGESAPGEDREAVRAALNGVIGDYLAETNNPLAVAMRLRVDGRSRKRVVVLIHGSSMTDSQWTRADHDHGKALARDLGVTPIYVQYNSGRTVADNGRALAEMLNARLAKWSAPLESVTLVGHSMGGLVARSAAQIGITKLDRIITIGTPHLGAPLERVGAMIENILGVTRYSAPLAKLARVRSAGITDLRHGDRTKMPENVLLYAIASDADKMVPLKSGLGRAPKANQHVVHGISHLDLLSDLDVYDALKRFVEPKI